MTTVKRRRSAVTEKQEAVIDAVLSGTPVSDATSNPTQALRSKTVQEEIAKARQYITDLTTLKRLDVIEGIMRSIDMGAMLADPAAVRQGWVEIGKILGHYAPEVKNINLNINQTRLRTKFEGMSDEDLLAIAEGRIIDGESNPIQEL